MTSCSITLLHIGPDVLNRVCVCGGGGVWELLLLRLLLLSWKEVTKTYVRERASEAARGSHRIFHLPTV